MNPRRRPFDLQGHRGARGLFPENTLAGFLHAVSLGVTTLETDLAVTSDGIVVISHDPLLQPAITRDASGRWISRPGPPIRAQTLETLRNYDVGRIDPSSGYARRFPRQSPVDRARIPTLAEVLAATATLDPEIRYNIEIKTFPDAPAVTLEPTAFAERVVEVVRGAGLASRVVVQSFDWRALLAMRRVGPEIATSGLTIVQTAPGETSNVIDASGKPSSWLVEPLLSGFDGSAPRLVSAAGCRVWSPWFRDLDEASVRQAHALGLGVLPWTVNDAADMAAVVALGVDGLITDYPDRGVEVLTSLGVLLG